MKFPRSSYTKTKDASDTEGMDRNSVAMASTEMTSGPEMSTLTTGTAMKPKKMKKQVGFTGQMGSSGDTFRGYTSCNCSKGRPGYSGWLFNL